MSSPTLMIAGLVALCVSVVYWFVAIRLAARRPHDARHQVALQHFMVWWGATALNILLGGTFYVFASLGYTNFPLQVSYAMLQRLLLAISLYGLVYYLVFLLTGRRWPVLIGAVYVFHFAFLVYGVLASEPVGVYIGDWRTDLEYAATPPGIERVVNVLLVVAPPVSLSIAGLVLALRPSTELQPVQRYRLGLVCGALIVWWVVAVVAGQREALGHETFQLFNRFVGLVAALVVLAAYRPPSWAWRRLAGVETA